MWILTFFHLIAQCKGVAFRWPPGWSTIAPFVMKYLKRSNVKRWFQENLLKAEKFKGT